MNPFEMISKIMGTQNSGPRTPSAAFLRRTIIPAFFLLIGVAHAEDSVTNCIRRQVLLPNGQPAVGVEVTSFMIPQFHTDRQVEGRRTKTDQNGMFNLQLALKAYDHGFLIIDAPNQALVVSRIDGRYSADMFQRQTNHLMKPVQLIPNYAVSGRVTSDMGGGVRGSKIEIVALSFSDYDLGWPVAQFDDAARSKFRATSRSGGYFQLRGIALDHPLDGVRHADAVLKVTGPEGKSSLTCLTKINLISRAGITPNTNLSLVISNSLVNLSTPIRVKGRVLGAMDGRPLKGVNVCAGRAVTDSNGRFSLWKFPASSNAQIWLTFSNYATVMVPFPQLPLGESYKAIKNLEIRMSPLVTVTGIVVDAVSGGVPLLPLEISVGQSEQLPNGFVQSMRDNHLENPRRVQSKGLFSATVPAGRVTFHVSGDRDAGRKAYDAEVHVNVPEDGDAGLRVEVPRRPGILVQLESDTPQKLFRLRDGGNLIVHVTTNRVAGMPYADDSTRWFYPTLNWGDKLEVSMLRRVKTPTGKSEDVEIMPWTEFVADPKTWPVPIKVP